MRKIIFVDCFNTIIGRKTSDRDVLFAWSKALGETYGYPPEYFYHAFFAVRQRLGARTLFREGKGETEYTFEDVARAIAAQMNADGDTFYRTALAQYIRTEESSQFRNDALYQRLTELKARGCSLYLVSDFYCGKDVLREFLRHADADIFDDIFVSCEKRRSKRTGALYRSALKAIGAKRRDVLMIGDNRRSDRTMARLNGLHAEKSGLRPPKMSKELKAELKKSSVEREYDRIFRQFGKQYNYSNYAFPLYLFTKRLYERFSASGGKVLLFCAREGQFMKTLFDAYCRYHGYDVQTRYLYVSRNSVARLRPLDEEDFHYIKKTAYTMKTSVFLYSLSFTKEQTAEILQRLGVKREHRRFSYYRSGTFKKLLRDERFCAIYEENRAKNAAAFRKYVESLGINPERDGVYVVDVGWTGTIQNYIAGFFGEKVKVYGYYVGLRAKCSDKEGLLYSLNDKKLPGGKMFRHRIYDYEQILRADHGRTAGYEIEDGEAKAVLIDEIDNKRVFDEVIAPMQRQILDKFGQIMRLDCRHSQFERYACKYFYKMMCRIGREDAAWLERAEDTHYDDFGRIGLTFKAWGHFIIRLYHSAQNLVFRVRFAASPLCRRSAKYAASHKRHKTEKATPPADFPPLRRPCQSRRPCRSRSLRHPCRSRRHYPRRQPCPLRRPCQPRRALPSSYALASP